MRHVVWLAVASTLLGGCNWGAYFFRETHRPMQALEARMDPQARASCLLVMMPGMLDLPDDYLRHGFVDDAASASRRCDVVMLDAHFGYYQDGTLRRQVAGDVLVVADQRGYEDVWLVGISMGGMGALLVAQEHPELVDGVVLLAPFLGDEALVTSIERAGGLEAWEAPEDADRYDDEEYDEALWGWLQGYARHPDQMPPLYVGVGTEDRLRPGIALLAAHLPETHHGRVEGGHDWATWRQLWRRLLRSPPWDPNGAAPSLAGT